MKPRITLTTFSRDGVLWFHAAKLTLLRVGSRGRYDVVAPKAPVSGQEWRQFPIA
jgi:hypothetical protein